LIELSANARWPTEAAPSRPHEIWRGACTKGIRKALSGPAAREKEWLLLPLGLRPLPEMLEDALDHGWIFESRRPGRLSDDEQEFFSALWGYAQSSTSSLV
jgi:hypothetical protein